MSVESVIGTTYVIGGGIRLVEIARGYFEKQPGLPSSLEQFDSTDTWLDHKNQPVGPSIRSEAKPARAIRTSIQGRPQKPLLVNKGVLYKPNMIRGTAR